MKKLILLLVLASISLNSQSQKSRFIPQTPPPITAGSIDYRNFNFHSIDYRDFELNNTTKVIEDENTLGSRFIDGFQLGKIIGYQKDYLLRYDGFSDQMEIENSEGTIGIINKETINEVNFNNGSTYRIYRYTIGEKNITGYLKVIYSGSELTLLKKEVIKYVFEKRAESSYHSDVPAAYKKADEVYFIAGHNGAINSFSKKREFLRLFPAKREVLEKFIKTNNVKFSKEDLLVKLVQHVNAMN